MSHLSNPQAQRTIKLLTAVACTGVGIQSTFFSDYDHVPGMEGKDHVFSHLQREARVVWDRTLYGIDSSSGPNETKTKTETASSSSPQPTSGAARGNDPSADPRTR